MNTIKRNFVSITELGRKKGYITFGILEMFNDKKPEFILEFEVSEGMNQGRKSETINNLVKNGILPKECLLDDGYPNYPLTNDLCNVIVIEGKGLNYWSII